MIASKYRNTGQTCVCANRIYVHETILDSFADKYAAAASKLHVGDPTQDNTDLGPLVDAQGFAKVNTHVEDAVTKGARVITGGKALDGF